MEKNKEERKSFLESFHRIEQQLQMSIIGQQEVVRNVIVAIIGGGNVLLEGLPGLGKTQLVKAIGKVLGLEFSRIQFTPDLMPADITGTNILQQEESKSQFCFQKGPVFANLVLADEINRATPKTQSALLEAMQEHTVTVGAKTYPLPNPYFVLATQNPLEMDGTYPLPEAQMDRFLLKLDVPFPNRQQLYDIVSMTTGPEEKTPESVIDAAGILEMRLTASQVPIAKAVSESMIDLVMRTHPEDEKAPDIVKKYLRYGASPRGAQAILIVSRIYALLEGRYNVAYEDIKKAALPALRHRIFLNFEAAADGITADDIISELLTGVKNE